MKGVCLSCLAPIIWTLTANGKAMPVDVEPVNGGNLLLVVGSGEPALAEYVPADPDGARHVSHFVTCPQAATHRKRT
jgi:hypothetical protein